jgi:asparagine synthase (glutamine-hydrolysing)
LRGDLKPWAGDLLSPGRLAAEGVFDAAAIAQLWQRFGGGERKWHTHLWNVLMFQAWQGYWRQSRAALRR